MNNEVRNTNALINDFTVYLTLIREMNIALLNTYSKDTLAEGIYGSLFRNLDAFSSNLFKVFNVRYKGEKYVLSRDGIILVKNLQQLYDIKTDFTKLVEAHCEVIQALKVFRNKISHEPHNLKIFSIGSTNEAYNVSFRYKEHEYKLFGSELCKIMRKINTICMKLIEQIKLINLNEDQRMCIYYHLQLLYDREVYQMMNQLLQEDKKRKYQYLISDI